MHSPQLPTLVGLTGPAGVGKDTLADYLVRVHGFAKYSLASPLKQALNTMFGFRPEQWEDREWKERVIPWIGKSPRQLAQTLGTEWGRDCVATDIWLRCARRFIEQQDGPVVISDVRFDNEATLLRQLGGVIVRIDRPGLAGVSAHPSEAGVHLALIHSWISNDGSEPELAARAELALRGVQPPRSTPTDDHFA